MRSKSPAKMLYHQSHDLSEDIDWSEITDVKSLNELIDEAISCGIYAIDTEFHTERTYFPRLALVQIAYGGKLAIIDPFCVDISLLAKLFSADITAVFHAGDHDLKVLYEACHTLPQRIFDTQLASGFLGFSTPSLSYLAEKMLNVVLDKGNQLTDWTKRPLGIEQQIYAVNDVRYLVALHDMLSERLSALGRLGWSEEECRRLLLKSREPQDPQEAWWKIKQFRQLKGTQRGVAQEVAGWRENRARQMNIPARQILSDLALLSIANRPPKDMEELLDVRDISVSNIDAQSLFRSIKSGMQLPENQLRIPHISDTEDRSTKPMLGLALVYVAQKARQLDIDQSILATRADVALFYKGSPGGSIANSWRFSLIGEPLLKLFSGQASLAFDKEGFVILEERSYLRMD